MHKDPRPHSVIDKLFTHILFFHLQFICMAGWIISHNNKIWLSMAECPIHFGDFLGVFFFFLTTEDQKRCVLPDNVNVKKIWFNTEVRGMGMDQTATFLLPCPQRGFGLFSSSDHAAGCRVPHSSMDRRICPKIPSSGRRMQDRELVMFLKDGHPWY